MTPKGQLTRGLKINSIKTSFHKFIKDPRKKTFNPILEKLAEDNHIIEVEKMKLWLSVMPLFSLEDEERLGFLKRPKEEKEEESNKLQNQIEATLLQIRKKEIDLPYQPQIYKFLAEAYAPLLLMYRESLTDYSSLLTLSTVILHQLAYTRDFEECQHLARLFSESFSEGLRNH